MLSRIFIQNFALIDRLDITLHEGMQVVTGETGAGKSIILGALRLLLGERADLKSINTTESKSIVEAEFKIADHFKSFFHENDLDFEPHTVIRREISTSAKSRAFVNDVPVTLDTLKALSSKLIDIHAQFETSNLFNEEFQFKILDGLSPDIKLLPEYQQNYSEYRKLKADIEKLKTRLAEGNKEADYKNFLLAELSDASLDDLDLDDVKEQLNRQENAEAIAEGLSQIFIKTDADEIGILDGLNDIKSKLNRLAELSHHFSYLNQRFEENLLEVKDIVFELHDEAENIDTDPETVDNLNQTLNKVNNLFLKHNVDSVAALAEIRDRLAAEQSEFSELEQMIDDSQNLLEQKEHELAALAGQLTANRRTAAPVFSEKIEALLKQLGLEKAKMEVELTDSTDFTVFGTDRIRFLFQANPGFPLRPVQNAVSGGERSRVMLAVKKIMAEYSDLPTLILDEIDTGVSGKVAEEMGNVMREMAKDLQLIVITHLAQVAAKGNDNYKVLKSEVNGRTQTTIVPLDAGEKLHEIAQLLSGSKITDAALQQAGELMQ